MSSKVIQLHPDWEPVGQFIRVGRGYTQLDALLGSGRLRLDRAVLSPTDFISAANDPLLLIDRKACVRLRDALGKEGGRHIELDYVLALPNQVLKNPAQRAAILHQLSGLPFENLWLRVSQFGTDATALGIRRYISSLAASPASRL